MKEYAVIFLGAWRAKKDLTLEELASRTSLEVKTLKALEKSARDYDPEVIAVLSKALGIEPYRLFVHPAVQFDEQSAVNGVTAQTMATLLRLYVPDLITKLKENDQLGRMLEDDLPEDFWQVQGDKLIELMEFLRSCREDQPAALRALFSALETDSQPPHTSD